MGRKRRGTRKNDLTELRNLLERRASGSNELARFQAMLGCEFNLERIGHFLWQLERRTLTSWGNEVRYGTYDEQPFSGWRAGTPEWTDPIPCFHVSTGEWSYTTPFCTLRVWISRSLHGTEIDECGRQILTDMEQSAPTMDELMTAVSRAIDDRAAGRKEPLSSSKVLADRLSHIHVPTETGNRVVAMIRCGAPEAALLELN
ncbi:MAG: hypothetical protein OXG72_04900 [Acidobacteria bacterium]|nr:hypothetical protein [Acidobacteriota bacterium]